MIKLYDKGVYLLHGTEIVENSENAGISFAKKTFPSSAPAWKDASDKPH